ncbi:MAG: hypothetical protein ACO1TE_28310, partial [Prosthecobacter sp.]
QDPNAAAPSSPTSANYAITFVAKDPSSNLPTATVAPADLTITLATATAPALGTYSATIDLTKTTPAITDVSKYLVNVVAKGDGTTTNDSPAGVEAGWEANVGLVVKVGSQSFTLTSNSSGNSVYRAPFSPANPLRIEWSDITSFAGSLSVTLPDKWPDGSAINTALEITKLAADTKRKLFAMDLKCDLSLPNLIPGLNLDAVVLAIARTDGTPL